MANEVVMIDEGLGSESQNFKNVLAIDNSGASVESVWIDGRLFKGGSLDCLGDFSGTVKLYGSNEQYQPAPSTDGRQIGSNITTAGMVAVTVSCRWYKVEFTRSGGNLTAILRLVK